MPEATLSRFQRFSVGRMMPCPGPRGGFEATGLRGLRMSEAQKSDNVQFESGPPLGLQRRLDVVRNNQFNIFQRALLVMWLWHCARSNR